MKTNAVENDITVKVSVILHSKQYKELVKEMAHRKINNEKGVAIGSLIREAVDYCFVEKKKKCCV